MALNGQPQREGDRQLPGRELRPRRPRDAARRGVFDAGLVVRLRLRRAQNRARFRRGPSDRNCCGGLGPQCARPSQTGARRARFPPLPRRGGFSAPAAPPPSSAPAARPAPPRRPVAPAARPFPRTRELIRQRWAGRTAETSSNPASRRSRLSSAQRQPPLRPPQPCASSRAPRGTTGAATSARRAAASHRGAAVVQGLPEHRGLALTSGAAHRRPARRRPARHRAGRPCRRP